MSLDPTQNEYDMENFCFDMSPEKDKKSSKSASMYCNGYVKQITAEEAAREMNDGGDYGPRCSQLQQDLEQAWKDLRFEEENCKKWAAKEEEIAKTRTQLITWSNEQQAGTISQQGLACLNVMNVEESDTLIMNAREKRLKSQKTKTEFLKQIEALNKQISLIKSRKGSNVVYRDHMGNHCIKFGSASNEASKLQSLRRDPKEVARDFCRMLCTAEGILKISLEKSVDLVKEYQDCFQVSS